MAAAYYAAPESRPAPHAARSSDRRTAARVCDFLLQHHDEVSLGFGVRTPSCWWPRWCSTTCCEQHPHGRRISNGSRLPAVSIASILLLAIFELNHPGGAFIPGWIDFRNDRGLRAEHAQRARRRPVLRFRAAVGVLRGQQRCCSGSCSSGPGRCIGERLCSCCSILDVFVLFATVTRGSVIALMLGILYLAFRMRRQLNVVPIAIGSAALAASAIAMNYYVGHFTRSGSLGARLSETKFIGLIPDDRIEVWTDAWNRFLEHPVIGYGPYYAPRVGHALHGLAARHLPVRREPGGPVRTDVLRPAADQALHDQPHLAPSICATPACPGRSCRWRTPCSWCS